LNVVKNKHHITGTRIAKPGHGLFTVISTTICGKHIPLVQLVKHGQLAQKAHFQNMVL